MRFIAIFLMCFICIAAAPATKTESFDRDPQWDGFENHPAQQKFPTVIQDFGWSKGQIGGQVWRSSTAAWYAAKIDAGMDQPLSMDLTLKLTQTGSSTGVIFGFFDSTDVPAAGRPKNSLAFYFGGRRSDAIVHIRAYNADNEGTGSPVPPSANKRVAPGIPADGAPHHLTMSYDPAKKQIRAQLDDLPPATADTAGFKSAGVHFDRFGLMNTLKGGTPMKIAFTDIKFNQTAVDLGQDPQWESHGSKATFEDHDVPGVQAYGFNETNLAGGKVGEMGGILWRRMQPSYFGDRVGPFSLDDELHAEGTICMTVGTPDSGAFLGFFDADYLKNRPATAREGDMKNFVGVLIEGPTRVGHYFRPCIVTSSGSKLMTDNAPRLIPDSKAHKWSLSYDPKSGALTTTLDGKSATITLTPKLRAQAAQMNRFGMLPCIVGGNQVRIYVDDVTYTSVKN